MRIRHGKPYPLGATHDGSGVNFALFSSVAARVELCLFDDRGVETRHDLPARTALCWHGYVPGVKPGQRYGFRVHGPWEPFLGLRCNPSKLLLDPYAKRIQGGVRWNDALFGHILWPPHALPNCQDSAPYMPKSVVIDSGFDWKGDKPLRTPWSATVIYEVHVKGFTFRHPDVPKKFRGTYTGLTDPNVIRHLKALGVTAIELMPVHRYVHDLHLLEQGLCNYWGYNTIGFFAPHHEYAMHGARGDEVREFKEMVRVLHDAGIEVILDVVYGHTAEGNHLGPTLCFKGIDNTVYYRVVDENRFYYMDYTGTGNSLNVRQPFVLQLLMDSLRYWVTEMHVDGFRFDLAPTLARGTHDVDWMSAFVNVVQQDPVIRQVKLIAEPWDASHGGYQLGNFPTVWSEWNGMFRDDVRDFWRGTDSCLRNFAHRVSGSPDLYRASSRSPSASINFITSHDGFTLMDLVSYNVKHNEDNGHDNADGEENNRSWNCGIEGESADEQIQKLRLRQRRNLITTLLLSRGVPMLLAGDELGRTQRGNNNAYCQDNEMSWIDWEHLDPQFLNFVRGLLKLRREHAALRRLRFLPSERGWYRNDGQPMNATDWNTSFAKAIGLSIDGLYLTFNAHHEELQFKIPDVLHHTWTVALDTAHPELPSIEAQLIGVTFDVAGRSIVVLRKSDRFDESDR
jgi:isoamylase